VNHAQKTFCGKGRRAQMVFADRVSAIFQHEECEGREEFPHGICAPSLVGLPIPI
jgi:hypothetical protein